MTTRTLLDIFVPGIPAPQGSKRLLAHGAMVESSKRVKPWRHDIMTGIVNTLPPGRCTSDPVAATLVFYQPRPKSHMGSGRNASRIRDSAPTHPTGKPDVDKLARAVLDAVGATIRVWADDSQVVVLYATKVFAAPGDPPGVQITVSSYAGEPRG